jgi:hypothetical protein
MIYLFALAPMAFVFGAMSTWKQMKRLRSPMTDPSALLVWQDNVGLDFHKEGVITVVLLFNDLLRLLLATLCLPVIIRGWVSPPAWVNWHTWLIYYGSIGLALAVCWFIAGASFFFWIGTFIIQPVVLTLTEKGIYHGQMLIGWQQASHHRAEPDGRSISIYSGKCPQFAMVVCRFPTQEIYVQGRELIAARLSSPPPQGSDLWYRRKAVFAALLLLTVLPFFLVGLVIYPINEPWVWAYYAFTLFLSNYLSVAVIRAYQ